LGYFDLTEEAA